jgi:2-polyprenyl-3-methyl-5-hydroxy-6-metoxy-1,4-benzoquinol methylase
LALPSARNTRLLNDRVLNAFKQNMISEDFQTDTFEQLYLAVRQHEARVYTDSEVAFLPQIAAGHAHEQEWKIRSRSAKRLIAYIQHKRQAVNILEVGCGNGWLSASLANIPQTEVTGIDINHVEIEQAQRVFKASNLKFLNQDFYPDTFKHEKFDLIIFAAVLPYFESVSKTLYAALSLLRKGGEVHITDAHFYNQQSAISAERRCREYYEAMGMPAMADHYYHHKLDDLKDFHYHFQTNPRSLMNKVFKKETFYWVIIKPEAK